MGPGPQVEPTKHEGVTPPNTAPTPATHGHPRPDHRRERWASLEGPWDFSFDEPTFDRTIEVPFAPQSDRSGIGTDAPHEVLWYRRSFRPPARSDGERVLVHFGAVDFAATVQVDGTEVGQHRGGHTSFVFDVTDALAGDRDDHELVVQAVDEYRADQLRGKQTATFPHLVHYTATSGIWQPVWVEIAGASWIRSSRLIAEADGTIVIDLDVTGPTPALVRATIGDGELVLEADGAGRLAGHLADVRPWAPGEPNLYPLCLEVLDASGTPVDTVWSHVGFRTVTTEAGRWLCNGEPLRQRLLLDQGYWPDTLLTPPSEEALVADLAFVRDAGFDGVRKHQKIEDPRFLWHADRMGLLVWAELPSPFGLARIEGDLERDATAEWTEAIERDRNHPSVIAWVPFNESWGLPDLHDEPARVEVVRRMVAHTRALDPSRPVVDNSGWGHVDTDVVDVHDYDQDPESLRARWADIEAHGWQRSPVLGGVADDPDFDLDAALARWRAFLDPDEADLVDDHWLNLAVGDTRVWVAGCEPAPGSAGPLVISEFGGVGLALDDPDGEVFEYATARDADDLLARFEALCAAVESIPEVVGWCWTELADVQQEINGLLTADRRAKIDPARIWAVLDGLPWSRSAAG